MSQIRNSNNKNEWEFKYRINRIIILLLLLLINIGSYANNTIDSLINVSLDKFITNNADKYELITINQYDILNKQFSNTDTPFIVKVDFNGDNLIDFAIIVRNKITDKIDLLGFVNNNKNRFEYYFIDHFINDGKLDFILSVEDKGEWTSIDNTIYVDNDGITIERFNLSLSFSYYWKNNTFIKHYWD